MIDQKKDDLFVQLVKTAHRNSQHKATNLELQTWNFKLRTLN
jgi:hypothetical protein